MTIGSTTESAFSRQGPGGDPDLLEQIRPQPGTTPNSAEPERLVDTTRIRNRGSEKVAVLPIVAALMAGAGGIAVADLFLGIGLAVLGAYALWIVNQDQKAIANLAVRVEGMFAKTLGLLQSLRLPISLNLPTAEQIERQITVLFGKMRAGEVLQHQAAQELVKSFWPEVPAPTDMTVPVRGAVRGRRVSAAPAQQRLAPRQQVPTLPRQQVPASVPRNLFVGDAQALHIVRLQNAAVARGNIGINQAVDQLDAADPIIQELNKQVALFYEHSAGGLAARRKGSPQAQLRAIEQLRGRLDNIVRKSNAPIDQVRREATAVRSILRSTSSQGYLAPNLAQVAGELEQRVGALNVKRDALKEQLTVLKQWLEAAHPFAAGRSQDLPAPPSLIFAPGGNADREQAAVDGAYTRAQSRLQTAEIGQQERVAQDVGQRATRALNNSRVTGREATENRSAAQGTAAQHLGYINIDTRQVSSTQGSGTLPLAVQWVTTLPGSPAHHFPVYLDRKTGKPLAMTVDSKGNWSAPPNSIVFHAVLASRKDANGKESVVLAIRKPPPDYIDPFEPVNARTPGGSKKPDKEPDDKNFWAWALAGIGSTIGVVLAVGDPLSNHRDYQSTQKPDPDYKDARAASLEAIGGLSRDSSEAQIRATIRIVWETHLLATEKALKAHKWSPFGGVPQLGTGPMFTSIDMNNIRASRTWFLNTQLKQVLVPSTENPNVVFSPYGKGPKLEEGRDGMRIDQMNEVFSTMNTEVMALLNMIPDRLTAKTSAPRPFTPTTLQLDAFVSTNRSALQSEEGRRGVIVKVYRHYLDQVLANLSNRQLSRADREAFNAALEEWFGGRNFDPANLDVPGNAEVQKMKNRAMGAARTFIERLETKFPETNLSDLLKPAAQLSTNPPPRVEVRPQQPFAKPTSKEPVSATVSAPVPAPANRPEPAEASALESLRIEIEKADLNGPPSAEDISQLKFKLNMFFPNEDRSLAAFERADRKAITLYNAIRQLGYDNQKNSSVYRKVYQLLVELNIDVMTPLATNLDALRKAATPVTPPEATQTPSPESMPAPEAQPAPESTPTS